jgi:phenylacetate-coenzyme A ligase PaaK-like adenylate-forming protein
MWAVSEIWRTSAVYADAVATQLAPAAAWQTRREIRLEALLGVASESSPLYHSILDPLGGSAARLADVPPMRKGELMKQFDRWIADPEVTLPALRAFTREPARIGEPFLGRYTVWESSGSSGEPAIFLLDPHAMAVNDGLESARGPSSTLSPLPLLVSPASLRMAFVGAIDGHFASIVSLRRGRRLNFWLDANLRTFSFLQPIDALVAHLNVWQPAVLASYPSMAWVLAQEQLAGRLQLGLRGVWTGGETLTTAQREAIGRAFGAPVRDAYGASECLTIATECRHRRMHLNADWVILEPVDAQMRCVPEGEVGETTLLTSLANRVQPIVRYDLGDRVRFVPGACPCGSALPVIEVQGREDDVLSLSGAKGRLVHLAPLALTTLLEEEGGVFDFELLQTGECALELRLHGADAAPARLEAACGALRRWLQAQGLPQVQIAGRSLPAAAARGRSGKQRRVSRGA